MEDVLPVSAQRNEGLQDERGEDRGADDAADGHERFARMPPGRTNIITMKITKAMT